MSEPRWAAAHAARESHWSKLGTLGAHFAPIIGPTFTGGPEWPSRPGWQVIYPFSGGTVVCSNGLSDAFEDRDPSVGYGLEIYAGCAERVEEIQGHWLMSMVMQLSNVCAGHGGIPALLERMGALTVELENQSFPPDTVLDNGRVCALVGSRGPLENLSLPQGRIPMVCATLISPEHTAEVLEQGESRRRSLADALGWVSG